MRALFLIAVTALALDRRQTKSRNLDTSKNHANKDDPNEPAIRNLVKDAEEETARTVDTNAKMAYDGSSTGQQITNGFQGLERMNMEGESIKVQIGQSDSNGVTSGNAIQADIQHRKTIADGMTAAVKTNALKWTAATTALKNKMTEVVTGGAVQDVDSVGTSHQNSLAMSLERIDKKLEYADTNGGIQKTRLEGKVQSYLTESATSADDSGKAASESSAEASDDPQNLITAVTAIEAARVAAKAAINNIPIEEAEKLDLNKTKIDIKVNENKDEMMEIKTQSSKLIMDKHENVKLEAEEASRAIQGEATADEETNKEMFAKLLTDETEAADVVISDTDGVTENAKSMTGKVGLRMDDAVHDSSGFVDKTAATLHRQMRNLTKNSDQLQKDLTTQETANIASIHDEAFTLSEQVAAEGPRLESMIRGYTSQARADAEAAVIDVKQIVNDTEQTVHDPAIAVKGLMKVAEARAQNATEVYEGSTSVEEASQDEYKQGKGLAMRALTTTTSDFRQMYDKAKTESSTELQDLKGTSGAAVQVIRNGDIWDELSAVLQELKTKSAAETVTQSRDLSALAAKLKGILRHVTTARRGNLHVTLARWGRESNETFEEQKASLADVEDMISTTETEFDAGRKREIRLSERWVNESHSEMKDDILADQRMKESEIKTTLDNLRRVVKRMKFDDEALDLEQQQNFEYLAGSAGGVESDIKEYQDGAEALVQKVLEKADVTKEGLDAMNWGIIKDKYGKKKAIDAEYQKQEEKLTQTFDGLNTSLTQDLSAQTNLKEAGIDAAGEKVAQVLEHAQNVTDELVDLVALKAGQISEGASNRSNEFDSQLTQLEDDANDARAKADAAKTAAEEAVESLAQQQRTFEEEIQEAVTSQIADATAAAQNQSEPVEEEVHEELEELGENQKNWSIGGIGEVAIAELEKNVNATKDEIKNMTEEGNAQAAEVTANISATETEANANLETISGEVSEEANKIADAAQAESDSSGAVVEKEEHVLSELKVAETQLKTEQDNAADKLASEVAMQAKVVHAENEAAMTEAMAPLRAIRTDISGQVIDDGTAKFKPAMQELQQRLTALKHQTNVSLSSLLLGVDKEKEMLKMNLDVVDQFRGGSVSTGLRTIEAIVNKMHDEEEVLTRKFQDAEAKAAHIKSKSNAIFEGNAFKALNKVLNAQEVADHAQMDSQKVLEFFNTHETKLEAFQAKTLSTLEALEGASDKNRQEEGQGANLTKTHQEETDLEGKLVDEIGVATGKIPAFTLSGAVDALTSAHARSLAAIAGGRTDPMTRLNALKDGLSKNPFAYGLSNVTAGADAGADRVGRLKTHVNAIDENVWQILKYDERVAKQQKAKINQRAAQNFDKAMYGESLMQTGEQDEQLTKLLQQNVKLAMQRSDLEKRHEALGKDVHAIAAHLREHVS